MYDLEQQKIKASEGQKIPKIIFQTYKEDSLELCPTFMKDCAHTWKNQNPLYEYRYISDREAKKFIFDRYGKDFLKLFVSVPINVIKADIIRLAYIYEYGGVYADMDTICQTPLDYWIKLDKDLVVSVENQSHLVQWFFASSPKNPIIKNTIDQVFSTIMKKDYSNLPHFVMGTGSFMLTKSLLDFYEVKGRVDISTFTDLNNQEIKTTFMPIGSFINGHVKHIFGSKNWDSYERWSEDALISNDIISVDMQECFWNFWRWNDFQEVEFA